jgi:dTDP-4-amino-4,6-dideoxygalactose transaminase
VKIPITDLHQNYYSIKDDIDRAVAKVLEKTHYILGEEVSLFESAFSDFCSVKYSIGVANGTDALRIALIASGVKPGDEVITSPFTFIATTEAIIDAGARPVFADIDPETYNISSAGISRVLTKRTKAILPVHLYGQPCDMDEILDISKANNLLVIEDCAQAFSARYTFKNGKTNLTGSIGNAGCHSFFPAKNLGCFGDGGMITTSDPEIAEKAKMLRNHGSKVRYFHDIHGYNSRLDTLQAAILLVKLKHINEWTEMRNKTAQKYAGLIGKYVKSPKVKTNCYHSFNYYNVLLASKKQRDDFKTHLETEGISSMIYYPVSLHLQNCYKHLGYKAGDFPVSENVQDRILALPMYPEISDEQLNYIASAFRSFFNGK